MSKNKYVDTFEQMLLKEDIKIKKLDGPILHQIMSKIKNVEGVINLTTSEDVSYEGELKFGNNTFYIETENTQLNIFGLAKFQEYDNGADFNKFQNYLDKKFNELEQYLIKAEQVKQTVSNLKNIVNEINNLGLELSIYSNFRKLEYAYWKNNMLMVTIYVTF